MNQANSGIESGLPLARRSMGLLIRPTFRFAQKACLAPAFTCPSRFGRPRSCRPQPINDLDAVLAAMKDVKVVMPVRAAFYGMHEFSVQDPGGHFITFAQPVAPPQ